MTPTATQLKFRLDQRLLWFHNEWFFKWHHIGGQRVIDIDMFGGRHAHYAGIKFSGSAHDVYWNAIKRGLRKEVIEEFAWVEERVHLYAPQPAKFAIDECATLLTEFSQSVRHAAVQKYRALCGNGIELPEERDFGNWNDVSPGEIALHAAALKEALFPEADVVASPSLGAASDIDKSVPKYQVALSFAGEQRDYVEGVARALRARGITVFYDRFEVPTLWGKDGAEFFHQLFAADSAYVVMFISKEYLAKKWPRHERRSALTRAIAEEKEYVLPVRFDDSIVPGLPDTVQYVTSSDYDPAALAALISEKIGIPVLDAKASDLPPPQVSSLSGEVKFDHAAFNGHFVIGRGTQQFETKWSSGSDTSVYLYNDPPSIHGIAVARGVKRIADIVDASVYDFTSRARPLQIGEIAVVRNVQGFYAAIELLAIEDSERGADRDEVSIKFVIQPDGSASFSAYTDDSMT